MNWQPIDTAPLDKAILVHCLDPFVLEESEVVAWWRDGYWVCFGGDRVCFPSCWMPLPEPLK